MIFWNKKDAEGFASFNNEIIKHVSIGYCVKGDYMHRMTSMKTPLTRHNFKF